MCIQWRLNKQENLKLRHTYVGNKVYKGKFKVLSWIKLWSISTSLQLEACTKHSRQVQQKEQLNLAIVHVLAIKQSKLGHFCVLLTVMEERFGRICRQTLALP